MSSVFITNWLIRILKISLACKLPITRIIKITVFNHFCGGVSIKDSQKTISKLYQFNIGTILDFSVEGNRQEENFKRCLEEVLQSIEYAKGKSNIPYSVFKFTGIADSKVLIKFNNKKFIDLSNNIDLVRIKKRVDIICKKAYESDTPVFVDAEESWMQNTIDIITLEMMKKYNLKQVIVYNTLQFYRKDRLQYLNKLLEYAKNKNFKLGIKLVRGAYHNQEIARAKEMNYECPVYKKKDKTDYDYNKALDMCIKNLNQVSICLGTHNEGSILHLINLMKEYNIGKDDKRISFSQLYGMSDHITYNLVKHGYNTTKYVPYGPVKEVIPYLIRRAEENKSITGQMGRELSNIIDERNRRKNQS